MTPVKVGADPENSGEIEVSVTASGEILPKMEQGDFCFVTAHLAGIYSLPGL